jgi:membrane protease YdiL (CAAX protease family)
MQNQGNGFPMRDKKARHSMNSKIDRKRIFIFLGIAFGITVAVVVWGVFTGGVDSTFSPKTDLMSIVMYAIAFAPALANIATRLITREGWSNTYLRPNLRRGWPYYLAAFTLPLLAIILGGAIYYLVFPGRFDPSMTTARLAGKILDDDTLVSVMGRRAIEGFLQILFGAALVFIGEEFGWRAYLLPKLMPVGSRKAVLLTGVIWSAWHWPMIIMGFNYGTGYWGAPVSALLVFTLVLLPFNILLSWVTLRTGSVWPACIAHAENNAFCYLMILFLIGKPDVLIGPSNEGIVGWLGYVLIALPIFLIPGALAPVAMTVSKKSRAVEKAADQTKLGTIS